MILFGNKMRLASKKMGNIFFYTKCSFYFSWKSHPYSDIRPDTESNILEIIMDYKSYFPTDQPMGVLYWRMREGIMHTQVINHSSKLKQTEPESLKQVVDCWSFLQETLHNGHTDQLSYSSWYHFIKHYL